jgi:hypothetical protein
MPIKCWKGGEYPHNKDIYELELEIGITLVVYPDYINPDHWYFGRAFDGLLEADGQEFLTKELAMEACTSHFRDVLAKDLAMLHGVETIKELLCGYCSK